MDTDLKENITKTGTSLVGLVCKDGVVMASDRKVTFGGQVVADKNFKKTVQVNDYLLISVAGNASDAQMNTRIIAAQLKLKELKDKKRPTIKEAASFIATMKFQNIRQPSMIPAIVGNLVAGFDEDGAVSLYNLGADGTINEIETYDASGSGMLYIWGLLERQYKPNLSLSDGIDLAKESIMSASERDTASGSGIDVFTVTRDGIKQVSSQKSESVYKEQ